MADTRTKRQCLSCGGTYFTHGTDGVPYLHVCPDQLIDTPAVCDPKTGDTITPATFKPTPNPRNENEVHNPDPKAPREIISEGSGYKVLQ